MCLIGYDQSITYGGKQILAKTAGIADTGTTLIYGDSPTVKGIYDKIPGAQDASSTAGQGLFTIPCDSVPDGITVTIEGKDFPISKDSFSLGPVSDGSKDCVGGLVADDSMGFWILGDVFLRNVYTCTCSYSKSYITIPD